MAKRLNPEVVIVPHYVGKEKATDVFRRILTDEVEKKIAKANENNVAKLKTN